MGMIEFVMQETEEMTTFGSVWKRYEPVAELVRCKDCEYCYFASNRVQDERSYACGKYGIDVTPDWFCADGCADGERSDGDE